MPTHVSGSHTQQDPLRLKNLLRESESQLNALGHSSADSGRVLAAAQSLMDDREVWRHQELGLAVFLAGGEMRTYTLPVPVRPHGVVGHAGGVDAEDRAAGEQDPAGDLVDHAVDLTRCRVWPVDGADVIDRPSMVSARSTTSVSSAPAVAARAASVTS